MTGKITEDKKYIADQTIGSYMVDARQRLKPSAFMDLAQEIAYGASTAMHFGYEDLQKKHFIWVLTRMQIRFHRYPRWREKVELSTWGKKAVSVFFLRDFLMRDTDGNPLIEATSSWTVIDVQSRKMVRGEDMHGVVSPEWYCLDHVFEEPAEKIIIPKDTVPEPIAGHIVSYSDIDVVGHTNNTRYVAWAMDCLDYDYLLQHPIREINVNFNQECRAGQTVQLCRIRQNDTWYVTGQADGKQMFAVEMKF